MKKIMLLSLALLMAACPVACVDDPTADDTTMPCVDDSTDVVESGECTVGDVDVGDTGTAV